MRCSCSSILNLRPLSVQMSYGATRVVQHMNFQNKTGNPKSRLRPFGVGLNWFPRSICVSEASPTACDFHSRPTGFPKRSFQNQFQRECKVCLAGLPCSRPFLFRRTRRTPKFYTTQPLKGSLVDVEERNIWPQHATAHERNQKPSKNQEVEMHQGLKSWLPSFPGERLSPQSPKS